MSSAGAVVVGGGIGGVSVAAELAALGVTRPVLLEAEPELARHTTGRSAASYIPGHGAAPMQALVAASRDRFDALADEAGHPFLRPRPVLHVATTAEEERALRAELLPLDPVTEVSAEEAVRRWPALRPELVRAAAVTGAAMDADPMGLHEHYRRGFRAAGGDVRTGSPVVGLARTRTGWRVRTPHTELDTDLVVLAAGAWTDRLLALAGAPELGLTAFRRTIAVVRVPDGAPVRPDDPFVVSAADHWYAKPESAGLLVSPSEETPQEPGDARPDELDVALAIERVNAVTTLGLRSVVTAWAGQRTFAPGRVLVVGERAPGLVVVAGQGGSGIETAPAAAALAAAVFLGLEVPADLRDTACGPTDTRRSRSSSLTRMGQPRRGSGAVVLVLCVVVAALVSACSSSSETVPPINVAPVTTQNLAGSGGLPAPAPAPGGPPHAAEAPRAAAGARQPDRAAGVREVRVGPGRGRALRGPERRLGRRDPAVHHRVRHRLQRAGLARQGLRSRRVPEHRLGLQPRHVHAEHAVPAPGRRPR